VSNRLEHASSPYLLQHKDNPVDWWEWDQAAFEEARRRDVPLFISVGYAACHWCHVMAHESFEDERIAQYLNENFVSIKVDREERPDVDAVYMTATQALTGHGGWPMTVFATSEGEPFYAGTYFPPTPHHGLPSFGQLLEAINKSWRTERDRLTSAATRITTSLSERTGLAPAPPLEVDVVRYATESAVDGLAQIYDGAWGGFGGAPKFPPSMVLEFLLRMNKLHDDPRIMTMVEGTCQAMARGGMYDQLAGGFARYSVDGEWVVPHFEKMLYDNALLLSGYLHWWRDTGNPLALKVVRDTAGFLIRDLQAPQGGFISSLDADTEGHEGLTYVWTPDELAEVLGAEDGQWTARLFNVTDAGTFEAGSSVLQLHEDPDDHERFENVCAKLWAARGLRPQPGRDDKIVAAWNGLTIAAMIEAGALCDQPAWTAAAIRAAERIVDVHLVDGRLSRTSKDGVRGKNAGVLEDYACVAQAFLAIYQHVGGRVWLERAAALIEVVVNEFRDAASNGFFDTAASAEALILRPADPTDNATPSGWAAACGALLTYSALTNSLTHREIAETGLAPLVALGAEHPRFAGWGLAVLTAWLDGPREVAIVGDSADPRTHELWRVVIESGRPGLVHVRGDGHRDEPLLLDRAAINGMPTAYVCRQFVCSAPVQSVQELVAELSVEG
jgi:hypothetical protein